MNISEVQIFLVNEDKLRAYATITIDDCFVVRDLKIIQGLSGVFVAMPAKKRKDGSFRDIAHPLNQETRALLENKILDAYHKHLAEGPPLAARPLTGDGQE